MMRNITIFCLLKMFEIGTGNLGKILVQGASAGDVQNLVAPADSEDRLAGLQYLLQKRNLKLIQRRIG